MRYSSRSLLETRTRREAAGRCPCRPVRDFGSMAKATVTWPELKGAPVFKWSRLGYDGKGVLLSRDTPEGRARAVEFCRISLVRGIPVYAEARIAFRRELALVVQIHLPP